MSSFDYDLLTIRQPNRYLLRMLGLTSRRLDDYIRHLEDTMPNLTHIVTGA